MVARKGTDGRTARGRAMQRLLARWERSGLTLAEAPRPAPAPFEIVFGDGTVVRVPVAFDAEALDRLLVVIVGRGGC